MPAVTNLMLCITNLTRQGVAQMGTGLRNDHQRRLFSNSVQYLLTAPKGGFISLSVYTFEGKLQ